MKKLTAIIEKNEDSFFAYLDELEGCVAGGTSYEEVKSNLEEIINEFTDEASIYDYLKKHPESAYSFTTTISCANLFYEKFLKTISMSLISIVRGFIKLRFYQYQGSFHTYYHFY